MCTFFVPLLKSLLALNSPSHLFLTVMFRIIISVLLVCMVYMPSRKGSAMNFELICITNDDIISSYNYNLDNCLLFFPVSAVSLMPSNVSSFIRAFSVSLTLTVIIPTSLAAFTLRPKSSRNTACELQDISC